MEDSYLIKILNSKLIKYEVIERQSNYFLKSDCKGENINIFLDFHSIINSIYSQTI